MLQLLNRLLIDSRLYIKLLTILLISIISSICLILFVSYILGPPSLAHEQNTILYSHDGQVIGYEKGTENRQWVQLDEINPAYIQATLVSEDQRFYDHWGFDFKRMMRAMMNNIKSWSFKEGASTLTQQYARNLYLTHDKTLIRKIKEALYTIRLEMFYSKDEILEGYLNTIYFGHGNYGIETASQYYLNKSALEISLGEAALLASIPRGPSYYDPYKYWSRTKERQQLLLKLLYDHEQIDSTAYKLAQTEHIQMNEHLTNQTNQFGDYFQDIALKETATLLDIDVDSVRSGGYHIYTTLQLSEQQHLETTIEETMKDAEELQVGALAMDHQSGAIRALVGGRDYNASPYNRAITAERMPGSTFKPFLYYTALHHQYTPSTRLISEPTVFTFADDRIYEPNNYNDHYANEPITLAQAIALSDNIYAVKTHMYLGVEQLPKMRELFGIEKELPAVPSLALGSETVSVANMVTGFSRLANGGLAVKPFTIEKIINRYGHTVYERNSKRKLEQVLDPNKAFIMTQLLTGMFDPTYNSYMNVTGNSIADQLSRPFAGKSGSTPYDRWMIGYSPSVTTGVWVGYDDQRKIESIAQSNMAKEIWAAFMERVHEGKKDETFIVPKGVVTAHVDPLTGFLATPYCEQTKHIYYEKGTAPETYCPVHTPEEKIDPSFEEPIQKNQTLFERIIELFSL